MKIEKVRAGAVSPREHVTDVDDDAPGAEASYDAAEQDWHVVVRVRGHADVGQLLLALHDGTLYWTPSAEWDRFVWRLVDDQGEPVLAEVERLD